jgi:CDP-4-dehydro-6-deoxyglucose reductase, E3
MSFSVTIVPSGRQFGVPRDETILSAALRDNVGLPYGCKDGACGSCKCKLLEGRVIHGAHQPKALSEQEEAQGYVLTCCATPQTDVVLEARQVVGLNDHPVQKMPVRVISLSKAAPDVMIVRLQLPATHTFLFHAGQFIEFILPGGMRRSYSMANAPHTTQLPLGEGLQGVELHIRHMPGGFFTDQVFGSMKPKDILRMEGPMGSFFVREDSARPMVLLASGTGFAPIKAIIEHLQHTGNHRTAHLYWGCRSKQDLYLHDWAQSMAQQLPWLTYTPVLSEPRLEDAWRGRLGLVHETVLQDHPDLSGFDVYACGAPVMVDAARRDFTAKAMLPDEQFHADAFTSERDKIA